MARHRCCIPAMDGNVVLVSDEQAHHITRVLRLGEGDELVVFDGRGGEWLARIQRAARGAVTIERLAPLRPVVEPPVAVTLAIGLLKGDQMSTVVRDATALGVTAIAPFVSAHVALPAAAWRNRAVERWARVAESSAAQCGRAVVPIVHDVVPVDDLLRDSTYQARWLCVEPGHGQEAADDSLVRGDVRPGTALLLVGPEGGWSDDEVARARAAGAVDLSLGPRTLRAEIAPTVALSVLWARWGW